MKARALLHRNQICTALSHDPVVTELRKKVPVSCYPIIAAPFGDSATPGRKKLPRSRKKVQQSSRTSTRSDYFDLPIQRFTRRKYASLPRGMGNVRQVRSLVTFTLISGALRAVCCCRCVRAFDFRRHDVRCSRDLCALSQDGGGTQSPIRSRSMR